LAPDHGGRLPTAIVVPGGEALAVSTLGWQAVYRLLAEEPRMAVERVFPDKTGHGPDGGEPVTREASHPLSSFPVLAFSVTYEEDYLLLARTLEASGVPPLAAERPDFPLVLAGGPPAFLNPAPIAPFVDLFWVGEANEDHLQLLLDLREHIFAGGSKSDFLEAVKDRPGVYVPGRSKTPVRRVVSALGSKLPDPAWSCFVSPTATFKDTLLLEVNRGCPYGCRFCAAGYIYRPPRHADIDVMKDVVERTNPLKVGLVGTALTDWPDLLPFLKWLKERKTKFSLSSMRADGITEELLVFLRQCGIRTITLALEGASERLRNMASKKLDPDDFLKAVRLCARYGVNHLKSYIIVGWPGETDEDYEELSGFMQRIIDIRSEEPGGRKKSFMRITLGASCLVPKPWTPFQWAPMATEDQLDHRLKQLRKLVKPYKGLTLTHDSPFQARLQGLLARGDERIADFIMLAAKHGGWKKALKRWDGDPSEYLDRVRADDEPFPWECVDIGVRRAFMLREWHQAQKAVVTPGCPGIDCGDCKRCGMQDFTS